jgi:hypothetical protein
MKKFKLKFWSNNHYKVDEEYIVFNTFPDHDYSFTSMTSNEKAHDARFFNTTEEVEDFLDNNIAKKDREYWKVFKRVRIYG